ncbi:MAG: MBG domain-containing protein, partial [Candidatus Acidiferrales bacterium]
TATYSRVAGENASPPTYHITATLAGALNNYTITNTGADFTIKKATLTITPDGGKSKIYHATFSAFTGVVTGLKFSDAVTMTYASGGAPAAAAVGSYDITVASVTFTSGSAANYTIIQNTAVNGLVVTYNICVLYDPTQPKKLGSTIPIKLQLCDVNGVNYSSAAITVHATQLLVIGSTNNPLPPEDSGNANPDDNFRLADGMYIFNLSTKPLFVAKWQLFFTVSGDPGPAHAVQFQLK